MRLRLLADDLTGALDSAAAFAGEVPVFLDAPPADEEAPVSAVACATRDVPPADLPLLLALSLPWLRAADVAFKKVDSLLRGNTFAECAHVARQGGFTRVVFAPAYPSQRRVTVDGHAWVEGAQGGGPQPIVDASLVDAFAAHEMPPLWVPDVRSDDDLRAIAAESLHASSRGWLWCGSAGLADALARVHGFAPRPQPPGAAAVPILLVSASHHAVTRRQWLRLRERFGDSHALRLRDLSPAERLSPADAARLLARQTEAIAAEAPPATLVVVGGDTLRALCRASGASALCALPSPRPGWGRARLVGGRWDGMPVHSRSGAFGRDDDLRELVATLLPAAG